LKGRAPAIIHVQKNKGESTQTKANKQSKAKSIISSPSAWESKVHAYVMVCNFFFANKRHACALS
jgi:hypothetical protein